jgi:hypothetical protein
MRYILQGGSHRTSQSFMRRGPGRPKGSRDTVPRRYRIDRSPKVVDHQTSDPSITGCPPSSLLTCIDDPRNESPDHTHSFFSRSTVENQSSRSAPQLSTSPDDAQKWFLCGNNGTASEIQTTQGPSSSLDSGTNQIDRGESATLLSNERARLIEADPFHFDWPYW